MIQRVFIFIILLCTANYFYAQTNSYKTEDIDINDLIQGTFYTPTKVSRKKTDALVILIAGSGPTDRNGNQPTMNLASNSLKFLAQGLVKKGISVFSYDKRLFALMKSKDFKESDLLFEHFIDDAVSVIRYFQKQNKDNNLQRKIIVAGHSEGSLIGMIASHKTNADAFISLSGAGSSVDTLLLEQIGQSMPSLLEETKAILTELKNGNTTEVTNPFLQSVFKTSVQPYIISWLKYNPQQEFSKLRCPVMIVGGTADFQVKISEAERLKQVQPKAMYLEVKNMNHVLKKVKNFQDNQNSYRNPNLPIASELIKKIVTFIDISFKD